jgi:excinuclease ABC subunit B
MYADRITDAMRKAIDETNRRRKIQEEYNRKHGITPKSIVKEVHDLTERVQELAEEEAKYETGGAPRVNVEDMTPAEIVRLIKDLVKKMKAAAAELEFERAAELRDRIAELRRALREM